jgi:hypothetical protein
VDAGIPQPGADADVDSDGARRRCDGDCRHGRRREEAAAHLDS